jgi:hypothetical protein
MFDCQGRLYLGAKNRRDPGAALADMPSAVARKERSDALLCERGTPVLAGLPPVDADEEVLLRPAAEVARRAVALCAVAVRGEGLEQERAVAFLKDRGLWEAASPAEQKFLSEAEPSEQDRIQFAWRYEGLWVMLWALGRIEALGWPDTICDVKRSVRTILDTPQDEFIGGAKLRPAAEILDELDLIYRCHWATTDARAKKKEAVPGVDAGVVQERHYALNWLTCYHDQEWDKVSTDT